MDRLSELQKTLDRTTDAQERGRLQQRIEAEQARAKKPLALAEGEQKRKAEREVSPVDRLAERNLAQPTARQEPALEPDPGKDREEEANRLERTRNRQPPPSQPEPRVIFTNSRAVRMPPQREGSETRQPEQGRQQQETPTQRILRERGEKEAVAVKTPGLSIEAVEAKIHRTLESQKREAREKFEADAVLKALEQGRVGKTEREFERGGRRI